MCYSVKSSFTTVSISLLSIIYLLSSKIPEFQWIGIVLIGWCIMQFAELLLWLTDPRKGCTIWNKIITMTLIPFVLALQPLGSLWGSLYVIPWNKSSNMRKNFMIFFTLIIFFIVGFLHLYKPYKICTTVTEQGHLYWQTRKNIFSKTDNFLFIIWSFMVLLPLALFWNKDKSLILPILISIIPTYAFLISFKTDSRASIWCHYTSYTSIISSLLLLVQQCKIYNFTK
jgi:hypothetical protein